MFSASKFNVTMKVLYSSIIRGVLRRYNVSKQNQTSRRSFHTAVPRQKEQQSGSSESAESLIIVEHYNAITVMGLNRPLKRNALNYKLLSALREELKIFESNEASSVAVLYGTGGNFCAGLDLDELPSSRPIIPLVDEYCRKPVIASVNGYAVGEGFDLAMACDVRIMDDQAILGCFNRRFGVPMSESALQRLSASAGIAYSLDIILSGRPINAEEAFQKSLVQSIVPCGSSKGNAITYAQSLTKFPQAALRADRAALYQTLSLSEDIQRVLHEERRCTIPAALTDMQSQGKRFSEGVGKHGKFKNLTVQTGWPEWMKT